MEEVLIVILQFLGEVILEVLASSPLEFFSNSQAEANSDSRVSSCIKWFAGGALLGGLSLLVLHNSMISLPILRLANLLLAPILSGLVSKGIASYRAQRDPAFIPHTNFWQAYWFTFGLVVIRFMYAYHQ